MATIDHQGDRPDATAAQAQAGAAVQLSAVLVARPCSQLGIRGAAGTVAGHASDEHRCFWGGYRLRLTSQQQEEFCLRGRFSECPVIAALEPRPPSRGARSYRGSGYTSGRRPRGWWFVRFGGRSDEE